MAGKLKDAQFWGPKATNLNNKVLLFGKYKRKVKLEILVMPAINYKGGNDGNGNPSNKILDYNTETEEWREIGTMRVATGDHGLSLVDFKNYEGMCMMS